MKQMKTSWWGSTLAVSMLLLQNNPALGDAAPSPLPSKVQLHPVKAPGLRIVPQSGHGGSAGDPFVYSAGDYGICAVKKTGYSWVTLASPVVYSMDVADCTAATASLLLLASSQPVSTPSRATNALALNVSRLTNGGGFAQLVLRWNQSSQILASLTAPSPIGSWSLALQGNQANLLGPSGVSTTGTIDTNLLGAFADPLSVYCFAPQQNWKAGYLGTAWPTGPIGMPDITISRIQVLGVPEPIDEQFSATTLNTNLWQVAGSADANRSMLPIPKWARLYLTWPQDDYHPYPPHVLVNSTLAPGSWQDLGETTNFLYCCRYGYLPLAPEVSGNRFFRLRWDSALVW